MGVAYFVVLDHDDPGFDTFVSGKAVAHDQDAIDAIASQLGLKSLEQLTSYGDLEDEFDVPDEMREIVTPWFEPREGLEWAAAIRRHVEANRSAVKEPERVIGELAEYEEVFGNAASVGAKWHFELDLEQKAFPVRR